MPLTAILLRVVLCLALVLNGSGSAMAAVHALPMTAMPGSDGHAMRMQPRAPSIGAMGAMEATEATEATEAMDADCPGMPAAAHDRKAMPDCCTSGTCQGDCMLLAAAVPVAWSIAVTVIAHSAPDAAMRSVHATPALAGEIRPPIV